MRLRDRAKSFLLYAVVCVVIAFALLKVGFVILGQWGEGAYDKWGGLAMFTLGLFALFVGDSEKALGNWRFWGVAAILLAAHLAAFAVALTHVEECKTMWFMVMVAEYPFFVFVRDKFVNPR